MVRSKRLIFIFILIIAVVGGGIYFLTLKSAEKKPPEPLLASASTVIWTDARTLSVLFEIENPNKYYGSDNYSYQINLYDDHDNLIKSIQKSLFIYAGDTETLAETNIDTGGNLVGRAEVVIGETNWLPTANFKKPTFKIESLETAKENDSYLVRARIYNPNSFDMSKVVFSAVVFSKAGREIAVARLDSESMKAQRSKGLISYLRINPSMEQYLDLSATKFYIYIKK